MKLENKMNFFFKNTNKDTVLKQKYEDHFKNTKICWFCNKKILNDNDKVRDHCHLTGKYRGPSHHICNINVKQKQSNFIPILFHKFSNYDCLCFLKL